MQHVFLEGRGERPPIRGQRWRAGRVLVGKLRDQHRPQPEDSGLLRRLVPVVAPPPPPRPPPPPPPE